MSKPKLIIVEGCQGSGKTTLTNYLREHMPYSQLYRLSGNEFSGKALNAEDINKGEYNSYLNHVNLAKYLRVIHTGKLNAILDRSFLSEAVYSKAYREDTFSTKYMESCIEEYSKLNMFYDVYFIMLITNPKLLEYRLERDKEQFGVHKFELVSSTKQQRTYIQMLNAYCSPFKVIPIINFDVEDMEERGIAYFLEQLETHNGNLKGVPINEEIQG